ncbi:MAG: hypothetical protein KC978_18120 [Candidatus Omnitrophica bacterium]|nr:hypothetical protein [Candidatus Omnitrophota bacterium]
MKTFRPLPLILLFVAMPCFSHPHFFKEVRFAFERGSDTDQWISVSHITVPYNEIAAGSLPSGESWHLGFAMLKTGTKMKIGSTEIEAGEYTLNAKRESESDWSLLLLPKGKEGSDNQIHLKGELIDGLENEEHLTIEIHPVGDKEHTQVVLEVRFGPYSIQAPIEK